MYVVSAALEAPESSAAPAGLSYGVPVAFKGKSGFFHAAGGTVGVVLCSPWGFEDLTMRKSWRLLAESLAAAGYPCLRFDYPGTGNSLGRPEEVRTWEEWVESVHHAADVLRAKSGVRKFVLLGQSLGASLALAAAHARRDVVGLQLIAPVTRGRAYVRELAATAALVAQRIGISHEPTAAEALSVVGFPLSQPMVDSLKTLDTTRFERLGSLQVTIYDQADRKAGAELCEHARRAGANVRFAAIAPYHLMISDATAIQPLPVAPGKIIEDLAASFPVLAPAPGSAPTHASALVAPEFREEPIRFGADAGLFGILCRPARPRPGATAFVLLNRGLNPHVGWRRVSVDHARALAAAGIASLRLDVAGVGESRDEPGRPANLIYSDLLLPDIRAAVDVLAARGHGRIALAGVCSGAYMALVAARHDARVTDVIAVNPQRLVWNPSEKPEDVIRYGLRSMNDYVGELRGGNTFKKLLRSRRRIAPAMRFLLKRHVRTAMAHIPLGIRSAVLPMSMAARVNAAFEALAGYGTRVRLVFTSGDPGLDEMRHYFGPGGRALRHANVSVSLIPDADHNLTATAASDAMLELLLASAAIEGTCEASQQAVRGSVRSFSRVREKVAPASAEVV